MNTSRIILLYILFTIIIAFLGFTDLVLDSLEIENPIHLVIEISFVVFAAGSGTYMSIAYYRDRVALDETTERLGDANRQLDEWKERHRVLISDMKRSILGQFRTWDFSPSEMDVAMYLIRGYSHKQISGFLNKSERTVRNQSLNIYRKAGMTGRSELAAFFMEDLFSLPSLEDEEEETPIP